jgi:SAM-dependent methyltransferase
MTRSPDVFGDYSRYYDLLYRDKDYPGEARFIAETIRSHRPGARTILELGCGTGLHALLLAGQGFEVEGVDRSEEMLAEAGRRAAGAARDVAPRLRFAHGDVRTYRSDRCHDVVASLFHVVSYQVLDEDLRAAFATAAANLAPGGIYFFDYWYGPAVLAEGPALRVKRMESDEIRITRIAEPTLRREMSCVDVDYTVFVEERTTKVIRRLQESHRMRYLFPEEIERLAAGAGFRVAGSFEWMTGQAPGPATWGVCSVLTR